MSTKYPFKVYLSQAFHNWYNYGTLILFGGMALIDIRHFIWYLMICAGVELAILYNVSNNPRFQRWVDSVLEDEREMQVFGLRNQLWPYIAQDIRSRYLELEQLSARLRGDVKSFSKLKDPMLKENIRKVSVLLASYLKLGVAVTRYRHYLGGVNFEQIHKDMERLQKELERSDERVREIKQKNIDILTKRAEKVEKAQANVQYLEAQMEAIADTMRLVVDQAITLSDPKGMGVQIDSLLTTLHDTELIAAEMESIEEIEGGYDDYESSSRLKE